MVSSPKLHQQEDIMGDSFSKWIITIVIAAVVGFGGYSIGTGEASASYDKGYDKGYDVGYESGYAAGEINGSRNGKTAGYNDGYDDGYTSGYNKGLADGKASKSSSSSNDSGNKGSSTTTTTTTNSNTCDYILNKNTDKFHYTWCYSVDQMKESNKIYFTGTRQEVINMGYSPCKNCDP
jgi:DNA-entry nuclease